MSFLLIYEIKVFYRTKKTRFYTAQLIRVLDYFRTQNLIYRDLKPENLLINSNGYLKLVDFSISKISADKTYTLCGTSEYIAPEVIANKGGHSSAL